MDVETPDDDLTSWAIPLDEPDVPPAAAPEPVAVASAAEAEPPRLSLLSRDVPGIEFQPRLRTDR